MLCGVIRVVRPGPRLCICMFCCCRDVYVCSVVVVMLHVCCNGTLHEAVNASRKQCSLQILT